MTDSFSSSRRAERSAYYYPCSVGSIAVTIEDCWIFGMPNGPSVAFDFYLCRAYFDDCTSESDTIFFIFYFTTKLLKIA